MNEDGNFYILSPMTFPTRTAFSVYREKLKAMRRKKYAMEHHGIIDKYTSEKKYLYPNDRQNKVTVSKDGKNVIKYITCDELCKIIGKSRRTLQRQIKNRQLPAPIKVSGKSVWPEDVILKLRQGCSR